MSESALWSLPATELAQLIASGSVSPVEVMEATIARVEATEPLVNAFATFRPEPAMDAAKAAENAVSKGETLGPLHGVPVTIKDLAETAGIRTMKGSYILEDNVPETSTALVTRLTDAGGISLGKTTTSEFGWKAVSHSPLTGITSNPWKLGYNAGASSCGAAAGAAAGFGPLHHGSDGAGSIRLPAHFSGVFGIKPTFGRIPNVPVRNNDQASHHGPLTRTVADSALMLKVMAGPHAHDHYSLEAPPADYLGLLDKGTKGLRIAYSPDLGHARVDPDVAELVKQAVGAFEELGASVEEVKTGFGPAGPELARFFWAAHELELAAHLEEYGDRMDPGLVACIHDATNHSAADYIRMRGTKLQYVADIHQFFDNWDLLLTPAASVAAFPAERLQPEHWPQHAWDWLSWAEFSYPFNMSGNPSSVVPAGFTAEKLPVGLQITGRRFEDLTVLQASAAFETARPWADERPPL